MASIIICQNEWVYPEHTRSSSQSPKPEKLLAPKQLGGQGEHMSVLHQCNNLYLLSCAFFSCTFYQRERNILTPLWGYFVTNFRTLWFTFYRLKDCGGVPKSHSPVLACSPFLCITPPHFAYLPTSSKFVYYYVLLWPSKFVLTNDRDANFFVAWQGQWIAQEWDFVDIFCNVCRNEDIFVHILQYTDSILCDLIVFPKFVMTPRPPASQLISKLLAGLAINTFSGHPEVCFSLVSYFYVWKTSCYHKKNPGRAEVIFVPGVTAGGSVKFLPVV